MPQLNTRSISASLISLQEAEDRGARPGLEVDSRAYAVGEHPRQVAIEAAARDVDEPVECEVAEQVEDRLHVEASGREQRSRERGVELGRGIAQVEPSGGGALVDELADQ